MKEFLDDMYAEEYEFEFHTILPEEKSKNLKEKNIAEFKKELFLATKVFKKSNLNLLKEEYYEHSFWLGNISVFNDFDSDLIVTKDNKNIREFIIDILNKYIDLNINPESTPAFVIYECLYDSFNEEEKKLISLYENRHRVFTNTNKF